MTKYILHGGNTSDRSEDNRSFIQEMIKGLPANPKLLLVVFAEKDWDKTYEKDFKIISNYLDGTPVQLLRAKPDTFDQQVKEADIIYLRGGNTKKLQSYLENRDLKKLFDGKVVAGSSAGTYVLSRYYYGNDTKKLEEGLGLLPVKTICHFNESLKNKLIELENFREKLDIYTLPNHKFVVINQ